jgi:hypothetical protein
MDHLQEAYLSVYEESEVAKRAKDAVKHQRAGYHGDDDAMEKESEASTKSVKKATKYKGPKVMPSMAEEVDTYDVILSHLLDEGFADTEKNAITIMANMSEAWIDEILDEAKEEEGKSDYEKRGIRNKRFVDNTPEMEGKSPSTVGYLKRQQTHAQNRGKKTR